jgi:hypothetical protein
MIRQKKDVRDRFMSHVCISDTTKCWEWTGHIAAKGYGYFRIDNKMVRTNRASYTIFTGHIADGLWVLHHCDNRKCVNPDHLFLGTQHDNILDMEAKKRSRHLSGESHGRAKLTAEQVAEIRKAHSDGQSIRSLGRQYGVAKTSIARIVHGKGWLPRNSS